MRTMGTTMQQEMQMTFFRGVSSGFTRKRKANPLAIPETKNQSQHMANT